MTEVQDLIERCAIKECLL